MCGIGGFSLSKNSRISPRAISNALLTELDDRGNQASGFAFQSKDSSGFYKRDVAGAKLNLKAMPKSAKVAILHTRFATHGSTKDMANNHPVTSPDKSIRLVHNGVIYNHDLVRTELDVKLPEVDSSVIPTILEKYDRDTDKLSMLDGDASIAWLDDNDQGVLRVARISHSPLCIAQLKDGSFVFASTETILRNALKRLGLKPEFLQTVAERKLLEVRNGRIDSMIDLPETDPKFVDTSWYGSYNSYRKMTSGNYATGDTTVIKSLWGDVVIPSEWSDSEDPQMTDEWDSGFPEVDGLQSNIYGEYYDSEGCFVGTIEDLIDWGFVSLNGETRPYNEFELLFGGKI